MIRIVLSAFVLLTVLAARADVTLEQCLDAARENYPLIKRYELLSATENIDLSDINKGWLPKIELYTQGTVQNVVPSFPPTLSNMMHQLGGDMRGLDKLQYRMGVDVNQTIWDGGLSKSRRETTRLQKQVNDAALDVELYGIRQRVESMYFGILLLQSQIEKTESAITVYDANLRRLRSMLAAGTAMQCDVDMVEAELLSVKQQLTSAQTAVKSYRDALSIFTGLQLADEKLLTPTSDMPVDMTNNRPELSLLSAQQALNNNRQNTIDATLKPKIGFFTQAYYGYPGFDYFKSMTKHDMSFNILAGVKLTWNPDAFYTKKNSLRKIEIENQQIETQRETFIFNNSIQSTSQIDEIHGIESVMAEDARIVELRKNVRLAAESQLRNGVIDVTSLVAKINDETQAQLNAAYHSIQLIQAVYNLKNTLNQ